MTPDELRDLQERVELVDAMAEHPGWQMLIDRARVTMGQKQARILLGRCETLEDYRAACSFSEGMEYVVALPARLHDELAMALSQLPPEDDGDEEDED